DQGRCERDLRKLRDVEEVATLKVRCEFFFPGGERRGVNLNRHFPLFGGAIDQIDASVKASETSFLTSRHLRPDPLHLRVLRSDRIRGRSSRRSSCRCLRPARCRYRRSDRRLRLVLRRIVTSREGQAHAKGNQHRQSHGCLIWKKFPSSIPDTPPLKLNRLRLRSSFIGYGSGLISAL